MIELGKKVSLPTQFKWYIAAKLLIPAVFVILVCLPFVANRALGGIFAAVVFAGFFATLIGYGYMMLLYKYKNIIVENGRITFNSGILEKHSKTISFDRVQNVETVKGIVASFFDIGEISIWSASPSQSAAPAKPLPQADGIFYLPSRDAEWLKNHILNKR